MSMHNVLVERMKGDLMMIRTLYDDAIGFVLVACFEPFSLFNLKFIKTRG